MNRYVFTGLLLALLTPAAARADAVKVQVYVLGIHLGNADAVLYSLENSYDRSKKAHPNATPLIRRQLCWSIDLAKQMGLATADMEALEKELDKLEFAEMRTKLQPILTRVRAAVVSKYAPQAGAVFDLSMQLTLAGGIARHATMERPETLKRWRGMTAALGTTMAGNIDNNKLEARRELAVDWNKRASDGEDFRKLLAFNDEILKKWQDDFAAAPAFAGGTVVSRATGSLTKNDPLDKVRKASHAKVHEVRLQRGVTYIIDLESGDGSSSGKNVNFFDTWLRVEDAMGKELAYNDDGGNGLNARLRFVAPADGVYRLVVTSYRAGATGDYALTVRR